MNSENKKAPKYSAQSLLSKAHMVATKAGSTAAEQALKLYFMTQDSDTPAWAKASVYGALAYFISPLDAVIDITPVLGYTDDLGVMAAAAAAVAIYIKDEHKQRAKETVKKWLNTDTKIS